MRFFGRDKKAVSIIDTPDEIGKLNTNQMVDKLCDMFLVEKFPEQIGLNFKIGKVLAYLERNTTKGKAKNFKLPGKIKSKMKNYYKRNKVMVIFIRHGGSLDIQISQIFNGMVWFQGDWRGVPRQSVMMYKDKFPCLIVFDWDLQALYPEFAPQVTTLDNGIMTLSPEAMYQDAIEKKRLIAPQTYVLRAMTMLESKMKAAGNLNIKAIILFIVGAVILFYVFTGGGA